MGECKWKPPEGKEWMKYPGCTRDTVEGNDFCLFHLELEEKRKDKELGDRFKSEFKKLHETGEWDFRGFVFPDGMDMTAWDFRKNYEKESREPDDGESTSSINFSLAIFGDSADFNNTTFGDNAHFWYVTFGDHANFSHASFTGKANFESAAFGDNTYFESAIFEDDVAFLSPGSGITPTLKM